jgi:hypothetical protein
VNPLEQIRRHCYERRKERLERLSLDTKSRINAHPGSANTRARAE